MPAFCSIYSVFPQMSWTLRHGGTDGIIILPQQGMSLGGPHIAISIDKEMDQIKFIKLCVQFCVLALLKQEVIWSVVQQALPHRCEGCNPQRAS